MSYKERDLNPPERGEELEPTDDELDAFFHTMKEEGGLADSLIDDGGDLCDLLQIMHDMLMCKREAADARKFWKDILLKYFALKEWVVRK